jgi:hypothetical protein
MRAVRISLLLTLGALLPLMMAPTGGFPSRPTFQSVNIGSITTSTNRALAITSASAAPYVVLSDAAAAANGRAVFWQSNGGTLRLGLINDTFSTTSDVFNAQRTSGTTTATSILFGNATDNPTYAFLGTGDLTLNGVSLRPLLASKTADTSRSSTVTLASDPDLQLLVTAGKRYAIDAQLIVRCVAGAGQGYRTTLTMASGTAGATSWFADSDADNIVASDNPLATNAVGSTCTAASGRRVVSGYVDVTGSGTLAIQWAQQSSNANATVMKAGSWMRATQLN